MFRIAVITDEISQDLAVAATLVKEFGGTALEIRSVWDRGKRGNGETAKRNRGRNLFPSYPFPPS